MTREINYLSTDGARRAAHRKLWGLCPSAPMSLFLKRVSASLAHPRGAAAGRIGAQRGGVRRRSGLFIASAVSGNRRGGIGAGVAARPALRARVWTSSGGGAAAIP